MIGEGGLGGRGGGGWVGGGGTSCSFAWRSALRK